MVQTAEENLSKKIFPNKEHVLCLFLPPKTKTK